MRDPLTKIFILALFCAMPMVMLAQFTASGVVTDASHNPLAGVSVKVKNTSRGTLTDQNGKFGLTIPGAKAILEISYVGYLTEVQTITATTGALSIVMKEGTTSLEGIVVVGSRALPRSAATTPLPVDNFDASALKTTGQVSFDKSLMYRVPSFNSVNTPVNDATTLLDPYEIRNLGPSRTLILINGKRKNLSSLLYVQFAPGRGETGADLSAIPTDAIKRVEILRDGASAQYGSDAIAGVMNIILKDRYQYSSLTVNSGITHKGDGATYGVSYNSGSNIAKNGFLNYTVDFSRQENAVRSGIIDVPTEVATFGDPTLPLTDPANKPIVDYLKVYPNANNTNGTGDVSAAKFLVNLGVPLGENGGEFYSNAALVVKRVLSNANYRTPYWKKDYGLLHTPNPNGVDYTGSTDPASIALYKGYIGYQPTFEGQLVDYNATLGVKDEKNGWKQDVSLTIGGNQQLYSVDNTVNHSLKSKSPTSFRPGGFRFSHIVGNYDISKSITDNFSLAFGSEIRMETYKIIAGDTASYSGQGANSFPGIRTENATTNSRFNFGAYTDASWDITKDFLVDGAIRAEHYSDFGDAFVWKLSSRYKLADDRFVIRGSASTGFRAPTLHQIYDQSTQASFVAGTIQLSGLFNNYSQQAFLLGVPKLKPEKSNNYTIGIGITPNKNFNITVDYYDITIKDRIVYSSAISSNNPNSTLGQILQQAGIVQIQFFINGIETKTRGIDYVANYRNVALGAGKLGFNLAGNVTLSNEIVGTPNDPAAIKADGGTILSAQIKSLLTESRPKFKTVVGADYHVKKWSFNLNNTVFGPTKFQDLDNGGDIMNNIKQVFKTNVVTDLNIGYDISSKVSASVTVNNLFNVLPKWELQLTGNASDPNYAAAKSTLKSPADKSLLEGFLAFSGRYRILGYNGSQFSQLGTIFNASVTIKF